MTGRRPHLGVLVHVGRPVPPAGRQLCRGPSAITPGEVACITVYGGTLLLRRKPVAAAVAQRL